MPYDPLRALMLGQTYDPLDDLLSGPRRDPLSGLLAQPGRPVQRAGAALAPPYTDPEERDSVIQQLLGKTMGGLQYVAETLDKPGRAVRGLLGGQPSELLNLLPFSDTLGITDPSQSVSGRDLLERAGILDANTEGLDWGDVAGFGAEVLTDPTTYLLGLGAATRGGKAAGAAGKGVAAGIRAGEKGLAKVGIPLVPGAQAVVGTGEKAAQFAETVVDPALQFLKYGNPVSRKVGQLFSPSRGGLITESGQKTHAEQYAPQAFKEFVERGKPLHEMLRNAQAEGLLDAEGQLAMRAGGETDNWMDVVEKYTNEGWSPERLDKATRAAKLGSDLRAHFATMKGELEKLGVDYADLVDPAIQYMARYHRPKEWPGLIQSLKSLWRKKGDLLQKGRLDFLKGFSGGTADINSLVNDPDVWELPFQEAVQKVAAELPGIEEAADIAQAKRVVGWVRSLDPHRYKNVFDPTTGELVKAGERFFNADPINDAILRTNRHAKQVTEANFLHELARTNAKHVPRDAPAPEGMVPLVEALEGPGLKTKFDRAIDPTTGEATGEIIAVRGAEAEAARRLGLDPSKLSQTKQVVGGQVKTRTGIEGMDEYWVPQEIAADMGRYAASWKNPEELTDVLAWYDQLLNGWKLASTQIWPNFHARNAVSGLYYHWVSGAGDGTGGFRPFQEAFDLLMGNVLQELPEGLDTEQFIAELGATNLLKRGGVAATETISGPAAEALAGAPRMLPTAGTAPKSLWQAAQEGTAPVRERAGEAARSLSGAVTGRSGSRTENLAKAGGSLVEAIGEIAQTGRAVGNFTEDVLRIGHYLARRRQGFSPEDAALSVKKWFFDYSDLTQFEKQVMKRAFPFYTFARNNLPLVLKELATKPGGVLRQSIRAANAPRQDGGFVPSYVSEGLAVPLPGGEGARYLTSLGLPFEQAFEMFGTEPTVSATAQRGLEGFIGQMNPAAKMGYMLASQRDPFSGRPLKDLYPTPTSDPTLNVVANSLAGVPLSRTRTLFDERKEGWAKALNFLTGMRVTDVAGGPERARELAARKINERLMSDDPAVKEFTRYYVPPEMRGLITPEQLQNLRLQETLVREARRQKKQAGAGRL